MINYLYLPYDKVAKCPCLAFGFIFGTTDGQVVRNYTGSVLQSKLIPTDKDLCYLKIGEFDTDDLKITNYDEPIFVELDAYKFPETKVTKEVPNQAQIDSMATVGK